MKKHLLALPISTLLVACGGGDSSSTPNSSPSIAPSGSFAAYNGFTVVKPGEEASVDLRKYVEGATSVVSIDSDNVKCTAPDVDQMRFSVKFDSGAYCLYDYVVKNASGETKSATITVLSTNTDDPTLPGISHAVNMGSTNQTFDVAALLGAGWKPTYTLNTDSLSIVAGENSVSGSASASGNTITFEAPLIGGWNRILYTVADSANPDFELLGTIYITISTDVNDAPIIDQPNYTYTNPVVASQSVPIDVAALPGLIISDDGDWQLIDVQSFTANVALADPDSVTNTEFTFVTPTVGDHVVSYTVADNMGGFVTGLINITVSPNEQAKSWTDLKTTIGSYDVIFSAAPLYSEALAKDMIVDTYWDSVVENTVAAFSHATQAEHFCSDLGRIPKVSELGTLRDKGMADALFSGSYQAIPKELNYLARSDRELTFELYDFNSGAVTALTGNDSFYVTCASFNSFEVDVLTTNLIAGSDVYTIAMVKKSVGETLSVVVLPEAASRLTVGDINLTVDDSDPTLVLIKANSTVAGTFRLQIDSSSESITTAEFNIRADKTSGSITVDANADDKDDLNQIYLMADGVDQLEILPHVTDQYSNDVADAAVFYSGSLDAQVTSDTSISITDGSGQASFILTGDINETFADGTYSKTYNYDLTLSGQASVPFTIVLKHANFYDTVQLTTFAPDGNTIPATIQVLSRAGVPRAATIEVTGGIRGSIIHPGTFGEYENDILQRINAPVDGAAVWLTTAIDNTPGGFTFELTGSPNSATASVPGSPRVMAQLNLTSGSVSTAGSAENVRLLLDTADSLEVLRGASIAPNTVYLPLLRADEKGKTVFMINAGQNTFTVYPDPNDLSISYGMLKASYNHKICHTRTYYWDGAKWMVLAPSLVPLPTVYWPNCANSDIYQ